MTRKKGGRDHDCRCGDCGSTVWSQLGDLCNCPSDCDCWCKNGGGRESDSEREVTDRPSVSGVPPYVAANPVAGKGGGRESGDAEQLQESKVPCRRIRTGGQEGGSRTRTEGEAMNDYEDSLMEDGRVWRLCWDCGGEQYTDHDCGEDICNCLDPVDNVLCKTCDGDGGWYLNEAREREKG